MHVYKAREVLGRTRCESKSQQTGKKGSWLAEKDRRQTEDVRTNTYDTAVGQTSSAVFQSAGRLANLARLGDASLGNTALGLPNGSKSKLRRLFDRYGVV